MNPIGQVVRIKTVNKTTKKIVLIGSGHSHLFFLKKLTSHPHADPEALKSIVIVSPNKDEVYSGLVPTVVSGYCYADQALIPVEKLWQKAGVMWIQDSVLSIDRQRKTVLTSVGIEISWDILSVNAGSTLAGYQSANILPLKPFSPFLKGIEPWIQKIQSASFNSPFHVGVLGSGAAAYEILQALKVRLKNSNVRFSMVSGRPVLDRYSQKISRWAETQLLNQGVNRLTQDWDLKESFLQQKMQSLKMDLLLVSTTPQVVSLGLEEKKIRVAANLQSTLDSSIYASGDSAQFSDLELPSSGVIAVRQGRILAHNLYEDWQNLQRTSGRRVASTHAQFIPPARTLNLLTCGDQKALAIWGNYFKCGHWIWRLKKKIDHDYIQSFRNLL